MAVSVENMSETILIPEGSKERFLFFGRPEKSGSYRVQRLIGGISDLAPGYRIRRGHFHAHELLFPLEGEMRIEIGNESGTALPGEAVFLPVGGPHRYAGAGRFRLLWFHFCPELLPDEVEETAFHRAAREPDGIRLLAELLYLEERRHPERAGATGEALWRYLESELCSGGPDRRLRLRLEPVFEKVGSRLQHPWSVAEMARCACMSESRFYKAAGELYGAPPQELLRRMRLENAAALLVRSSCSLKEIAERVGYSDAFAFSKAFSRYYNCSPRAFRAAGREGMRNGH